MINERRQSINTTNIKGNKKVPYDEVVTIDNEEHKYCRVCTELLPVSEFHKHKPIEQSSGKFAWKTGYQFECKSCKNGKINAYLNPKRTPDQLRESSEYSRLRGIVIPKGKIDSVVIFDKFGCKCFNCEKPLNIDEKGTYEIDHTLPHSLWWGYSTEDCTLLCYDCNQGKTNKWPSKYYTVEQLLELTKLTGWDIELLSGEPQMCIDSVNKFLDNREYFTNLWLQRDSGKKFLIKEIKKLERYGFI